jgi:hypothetical protein
MSDQIERRDFIRGVGISISEGARPHRLVRIPLARAHHTHRHN